MDWVSVEDRLPKDPKKFELSNYDVWVGIANFRYAHAQFRDGKFWEIIGRGDYSHKEEIEHVTHWITIEPPKDQ